MLAISMVFSALLGLAMTNHGDLLGAASPQAKQEQAKKLTEQEKIERLIESVEKMKGAKFVRNGTEYEAKTAARFLREKWSTNKKEIKTATDFIEKVGTKSSTSGKPYLIRAKDGKEQESSEFLKAKLKELEAPKKEKKA